MIKEFVNQHKEKLARFRWLLAPLLFGQHASVVEFLVRHYGRRKKYILDIGARRSPYTRSLPGVVIGLDLPAEDESNLGFTKENLKQLRMRRFFPVIGNAEKMPFQENVFDMVLMIEVLEYINSDEIVLSHIQRVLKPDGILIITTPNGETFPKPTKYHIRHYKPMQLNNLIGSYFIIINCYCLFPRGYLWKESIRSLKSLSGSIVNIIRHIILVQIYWFVTFIHFFVKKAKDTTTIILIAQKRQK